MSFNQVVNHREISKKIVIQIVPKFEPVKIPGYIIQK